MPQIDQLVDLLPVSYRKEWMRLFNRASLEQQVHPFSIFMSFLEEERETCMKLAERQKRRGDKSVKVHCADLRVDNELVDSNHAPHDDDVTLTAHANQTPALHVSQSSTPHAKPPKDLCILHNTAHPTHECKKFLSMSVQDRIHAVKRHHACYRCFGKHQIKKCRSNTLCSECNLSNHHKLLCKNRTGATTDKESHHLSSCSAGRYTGCPALLLIKDVSVVSSSSRATVFFNGGSNGTFITHAAAKRLKARRLFHLNLGLTVTGNLESHHSTFVYEVELINSSEQVVKVLCAGLEQLTGKVSKLDLDVLRELFPTVNVELLQRRSDTVDMLIGSDYCGLIPRQEVATAGEHLKVVTGPFGLCITGTHPKLRVAGQLASQYSQVTGFDDVASIRVQANHVQFTRPAVSHMIRAEESQRIDRFIEGENLGTELSIKCGNCKCGKCPITGHTFSFREEQELELIRSNLHYEPDNKRWVTRYPWIKNPADLPDNYQAALVTLHNTERTLRKDPTWARIYSEQIHDMVSRDVARKLSPQELQQWDGPHFYISHLAVQNPKSSSTPVRIVFNSSQLYKGVSLNSALAKGPDSYLNNLLGVLIRWRENQSVIVGDIKKMYNSIYVESTEQHCHRFLWRDLENRVPDVYVITRVNMGDRPAAAISSEAIYKTADLFNTDYPDVSRLLKNSTYVDDIVDSVENTEQALQLAKDTTHVLNEAGFRIKHWLFSGEDSPRTDLSVPSQSDCVEPSSVQVLGVTWVPVTDRIKFHARLNFSQKKKGVYTLPDLTEEQIPRSIPLSLTRRSVLEQTMRIYDPLGILSPFLLKAKILLRQTWALKLGWDVSLPDDLRSQWIKFFSDMFRLSSLDYDRCLKPINSVGKPILIILSDASDVAYGFNAYIRWQLDNGDFWCRLILSKCRIAPLRKLSTPQMELNGAVLSKRGRKVLEQEMRFEFDKVYQLVDSETILCMINKVSTRFRLFEGVRVGEIQAATGGDMSSWHWVKGTLNTADWLTRGKDVLELGVDSEWWQGPNFLSQPEDAWQIKSYSQCRENVELEEVMTHASTAVEITHWLDYQRYSCFRRYVWLVARILHAVRHHKFSVMKDTAAITPRLLEEARILIIKDIQLALSTDQWTTGKHGQGKYSRLNPVQDETGVWIVGNRLIRHNPLSVTPTSLPALLPYDHPITRILIQEAHEQSGHRGRDVTLAKFRQNYWAPNGSKLVWKVIADCQKCRVRDKKLLEQEMGKLPAERLQPGGFPFDNTMVDFFGPYLIRGEAQTRVSRKAYGVIFTDVCSRAVHIEVSVGYDTSSFLLALKRFTSIRGWPSRLYSDPGSQLIGAEKELTNMWKDLNSEDIYRTCLENGTQWIFGPADSSWHQGAVESLVKAAKRALKFSMNDQRLSASELLTVFTETANLLNERPIGKLPSNDSELEILTPNSLLIGRASAKNPAKWTNDVSIKGRIGLIGRIVQQFWDCWTKLYAPSLVYQYKWKKRSRNLRRGDVVAITDPNSLRGQYRIGLVRDVYPGIDGVVRKASISYKNFKIGEKMSTVDLRT